MPTESFPLVTIGLPIFNEYRFIDTSIRSLLNQDYPNFELLISDNGSTDGTAEILKSYAEQDSRIRYVQQPVNRGAHANFNFCLEQAAGRYFMWASGHDQWSENLVTTCVNALEATPNAVLAFASTVWVDTDGQPLRRYSPEYDTRGIPPLARLSYVYWGSMNPVLGVFRREALQDVRYLNATGTDLIMLTELAMRGSFIHVPDATFTRREVRPNETHGERMKRYTSFSTALGDTWLSRTAPLINLQYELFRSIVRTPISITERILALIWLIGNLPARYYVGRYQRNQDD